jgi:hypothetical protein
MQACVALLVLWPRKATIAGLPRRTRETLIALVIGKCQER